MARGAGCIHAGLLPAFLRVGRADFRHAAAAQHAAVEKRCPPRGLAPSAIVIGEGDVSLRVVIDIQRLVIQRCRDCSG